ncbi:sensor histidine kinase [Aquabacterium humicola]|uniref:sensor histidine kinase n=1 Tax=Aquabacterium humicola TaxID=3237377 RepID=UPI002542827B|nr:sensor histidine kinase [Rubrivivax pictus]
MRSTTRLRSQLLAWLLLPTLTLWAAGFGFSYWRSLAQAHAAYDRTLLGSAQVIAAHLRLQDGEVVADLPFAALEMLRTDAQDRIFYRVADLDDGDEVGGYPDLPAPARPPAEQATFYDADYKGERVRIAALRHALPDGARQRQLVVQVAETLEARHQLTRRITLEAAALQLALIGLAAAFIAYGVRRGLAPLKRLRDEVRRRGIDDPTPMDAAAVPREVAPLIEAINAHTGRQRQLTEAQVRFVANASHQLKTPLTLLRAQLDHALMQADLPAMRGVVERIGETTELTGRLVAQLLALARSEPGRPLAAEAVELVALAQQATFDLLSQARRKRIDLGFEGSPPVVLQGEPVLLRELVTNLVHNAISYTPEGGTVTVAVEPGPRLVVVDNGPGIPAAERERVLERFYRLPSDQAEGSGLGLAIVKEICARHGLALQLDDAPGGGLRVVVAAAC